MSLPKYPAYKDSGVAWLGKMPEHWGFSPIKRYFNVIGGSTPKSDFENYWNGEVVWVTPSDLSKLSGFEITDSQRKITYEGLASCSASLVPKQSIVLSTRAPIGALAIANIELCTNQGCKALVPIDEINTRFYTYLLSISTGELNIRGKGTTFLELSSDELGAFKVTFPTSEEQTAIANFLDQETSKIDALVAEQENLIALLKEKRQAVISHAVTKGLNPNAPMKDSGIEWLGEVPAHWEVKRLRFAIQLNPSKSEISHLDKDTLVSFLPMEAIGDDGTLNLDNVRPISDVESGYTYFREGDVTLAKITPCFENGKGAVMRNLLNGVGFGTTELIVARPKFNQSISDFLHYLFISVAFRKQGEGYMYGAGGQKRVPDDFMRNYDIAMPTVDEQKQIANYLEKQTLTFNEVIDTANQGITLLKERRSALISAAVTGKIDVRGIPLKRQVPQLATMEPA